MMAKHTMTQLVAAGALKDQTLREYVDHKLADGLMTAVQIESRFGESIVSMGPIIESQIKGQNLVRVEQSVNITPLVRCRDCIFARRPDRRKPAENRACGGTLICCVGFDHVYPDSDDGMIFVDEYFYCADGDRKDGGQDDG